MGLNSKTNACTYLFGEQEAEVARAAELEQEPRIKRQKPSFFPASSGLDLVHKKSTSKLEVSRMQLSCLARTRHTEERDEGNQQLAGAREDCGEFQTFLKCGASLPHGHISICCGHAEIVVVVVVGGGGGGCCWLLIVGCWLMVNGCWLFLVVSIHLQF